MRLKRAVLFSMIGVGILLAATPNQMVVYGQKADKRVNVNLGISGLENPTSTAEDSSQWLGSKIYFGDDGDILWKVLDKDQGSTGNTEEVFLLMDQAMEQQEQYHNSFKSVTWEQCALRALLNGEDNKGASGSIYGELFNEQEQKAICQTQSVNESNPTYNTDGGNDTNDLLFLLSSKEAINSNYGFGSDATRSSDEYWWLRTIGYNGSNAAGVYAEGGVFEHGLFTQKEADVYPAFNLDASQVFLTTASDITKADFQTVGKEKVSNNQWKLTLKDGNTKFQAKLPNAGTAGKKISVEIASLGDKEYTQVSAMLIDSNGIPAAYGKIANGQTGIVDIKLPTTLSSGSYQLYVFPENVFKGNATDYAGNYVLENNFVLKGNTPNTGKPLNIPDTEDTSNKRNESVQVVIENADLDSEIEESDSQIEAADSEPQEDLVDNDTYETATTKLGLSNSKKIAIAVSILVALTGGIILFIKKKRLS